MYSALRWEREGPRSSCKRGLEAYNMDIFFSVGWSRKATTNCPWVFANVYPSSRPVCFYLFAHSIRLAACSFRDSLTKQPVHSLYKRLEHNVTRNLLKCKTIAKTNKNSTETNLFLHTLNKATKSFPERYKSLRPDIHWNAFVTSTILL